MTEPAIELENLVKDYGRVRALHGISLAVAEGEIFGFLGPNGAGKTTAIRILFDLIRPTSGAARVLRHDCQRNTEAARARMGYLPGELSLYQNLTGAETIELFRSLRPRPADRGFVAGLLDQLSLDPTRPVDAYSKGNRQKLGLVLALMHRPEVLVLDEPTSGLDPLVQDEVAQLLFKFAAEGRTVFFSSHVLSEVERLCSKAAFLREGRLVAVEDVAALRARSLHILHVEFAAPVPAAALQVDGVRQVGGDGTSLTLEVRDNLDALLKAIARHTVVDLHTEQPSLEDTFRAYYETNGTEEAAARAAS